MDASKLNSIQRLEKHIILLKEEYNKLHRSYINLEQKYCKTRNGLNDNVDQSCFLSDLALTVASLFGRSLYSDLIIRFKNKSLPAHKFILQARSEKWREETLLKTKELDWNNIEDEVGESLLKWIYTDNIEFQNDEFILALLQASHSFLLTPLFTLCERALITKVGVESCIHFFCIAEEVGATKLLEFCSNLILIHWDEFTTRDFEHMPGPLLLRVLKTKTEYPLHASVKLLREDVVFLCLVEAKENVSVLSGICGEEGLLPIQMALALKSTTISEILIKHGSADINAYTSKGSTLLIDAIERGDEFAANFLLDKNCNLNLVSRETEGTALHCICSFSPLTTDPHKFHTIINIGKKIVQQKPNFNLQNLEGQTPLHVAIESHNITMIDLLLTFPAINLNIRNKEEKCPLELTLTHKANDANVGLFDLAKKLIELGSNPDVYKSKTNNSLLQELAELAMEESAICLSDYAELNHVNNNGLTVLHIAAEKNLSKLVAQLLKKGASPNIKSSYTNFNTALHLAAKSNSLDSIREFINFHICREKKNQYEPPVRELLDLNCKNKEGETCLSLSLISNNFEMAHILIQGGADVNVHFEKNMTLLHQAIINKNTEVSIFLLKNGADINALSDDKIFPLERAIECNMPQVVETLCSLGVSLSAYNDSCNPPLWVALELDHEEVAQILVRYGADTDSWGPGPEDCQQTLLHRAIDENKDKAAIFLIRSHCDLDSPRQPGLSGEGRYEVKEKATPLHLCCHSGLIKVLHTLIDHGANVNALDLSNKTPLHVAIENKQEEIITILLCHPNIELKTRDKMNNTPFAAALSTRNHKAAKQIINRMPNAAEQMDPRGRNFLHLAIMKGDLESVLFLVAIQVDVNSRVHDANQSTPLHLAANSNNEMITRNLVLAGARVNEPDALQKTPLHIAVQCGNLMTVAALIQNGADYDAPDGEGNNALHIAAYEGHLAVVRELLTESRVNAEAINSKGRTPLHELCRIAEDNIAATICELFFESMPKYSLNVVDMDGNTPLLLAFMRGHSSLCKVLIKNGACLGTENRSGVNVFNFKLATNQLLYKLLDQLTKESPWAESDYCQDCGSKFSLTIRKHHCRHCGRVLCSKCSSNDVPIIKFNINKPVRVCFTCFEVLNGRNGAS